ncbi:MAG: prolipoprotein diacylglyceryl transferase family protein, partial [Pseudomonadota bacterium]
MKPVFLKFTLPLVGEVVFPAYMTMLLVGYVVAMWLATREEDRTGGRGQAVADMCLWMLVLGVLGARALSVLADGKLRDFINLCVEPKLVEAVDAKVSFCTTDQQCGYDYLCDLATNKCYPPRDCLFALKFWEGGLAYYGGFLFAVPFGIWYAARKRLGVWRIVDLLAPYVALGLFFGRLGCFFTGCCFGSHTNLPWAVSFPGHPHVHPAQLYEAGGALLIFVILYFYQR